MLFPLLSVALAASPWAADLQIGDCGAVLAKLVAPTTDVERFVAGRCYARTGAAARAAEVLGAVGGTLASHAKGELAHAQIEAGDGRSALATLAGVDLPGDAELVLRGRAQIVAGLAVDAVRTLGTPPAGASDARLYWTGEAAAQARIAGTVIVGVDAAGLLQSVWTQYPTSEFSTRAEVTLANLGRPVPDYTTAEGRTLALARAKKLLAIQQAPMAIPLLDGVNAAAPFTGAQVMYMAEALFDAKIYGRAVEWFGRAGASTTSSVTAFHEALGTARAGDYPTAAKKYGALIARWPTSAEADEAAWKPAYMEYDAGHLAPAVDLFATYINGHSQGKFLWDARWLRAWSLYRLGRREEALVAFDKVIAGANSGAGELAAAARYWRARATSSDDGLREVLEKHPDTSYAYFAAARLGKTWTATLTADPPAFPESYLAAHRTVRDARDLADAGLGELALVPTSEIEASKASETTALAMAGLLMDLDRIQAAQKLAKNFASTPAGRGFSAPRPYRAVVDRIAAESGLPALLPYAIMTAESGLDPSVTSPAGARGLMQLMPALATELAKGRVAGFMVDDLYRAGVNTRLGTTELGLLHGKFQSRALLHGGSLPLVIAGYNGGANAVDRWLSASSEIPEADRFAEDISFTETRRYVRRVLGYFQKYRRVYGG